MKLHVSSDSGGARQKMMWEHLVEGLAGHQVVAEKYRREKDEGSHKGVHTRVCKGTPTVS